MSSAKNTFEPNTYEGNTFACGTWRGIGVTVTLGRLWVAAGQALETNAAGQAMNTSPAGQALDINPAGDSR